MEALRKRVTSCGAARRSDVSSAGEDVARVDESTGTLAGVGAPPAAALATVERRAWRGAARRCTWRGAGVVCAAGVGCAGRAWHAWSRRTSEASRRSHSL
eukprot:3061694-Prymnesium_polylepis.1